MTEQSRRKVLKTASGSLVAGALLPKVSGTSQSDERLTQKEYEKVLTKAKKQFKKAKRQPDESGFEAFQQVINDSDVSATGMEFSATLPEKEEDSNVSIEKHRSYRMDVKFYLYGPNILCPASDEVTTLGSATDSPNSWDVYFFFEHNPPSWSLGGEMPNDIVSISFADRNWYIPTDPRLDTSSRVSRKKEDPNGMVFEYEDYKWGNNEEFAQVQVKPDEDDVDPDARQVFGTYTHHWSKIEVENVSISSSGSVTVEVSDTEKQWYLHNNPDTGDPLKSSVKEHFGC